MSLASMRALAFLLLSFMSGVIAAAAPTWQIVPNQSSLTYTATQNDAPTTGTFKNFTGSINFDPAQLNSSKVRIVVDMKSVATSFSDVENALKTTDWFNVKLFPQAIFTATKFTKTGSNTYTAEGTLTLRDKTLPITLQFVLDDYSLTTAHAHGATTLKRTLFGVGQGEWAQTEQVKDEVQVNFTIVAERK